MPITRIKYLIKVRKGSSASLKDGQKDLKQYSLVPQMIKNPSMEQQCDIISSLHIIIEEIKQLKV